MSTLILLSLCGLGFWLSQRLYVAYLQAVMLEERHVLQHHRAMRVAQRPTHHLGPKFFMALDFFLMVTAIICLGRLFGHHAASGWQSVLEAAILFSVLVTFWTIRSHRRLYVFYHRLAKVMRGATASTGERSSRHRSGEVSNRVDRKCVAHSAGAAMSIAPLILALCGLGEAWHDDGRLLAALFVGCVILPQVVIGVMIIRDVQPMRRLIYDRHS